MLPRRLAHVLVLAVALAGCKFEPSQETDAAGIDAIDAPDDDALDAMVDALDAPIDACVSMPEQCNGLDDDCDMMVDETFPALGTMCDGPDTDLCPDDTTVCSGDGTTTTCGGANPDDDVERCNTMDDDCDTRTDEAFPTLGMMCDGTDGDLCREGTVGCSADQLGVTCSDMTTTTAETCNAMDDDCDAMTDEGFPTLGQLCDGTDGDACEEGMVQCDPSTGGVRCGDMTGTIAETCNSMDDDCDASTDETFDLISDPNNCGVCGRMCTNSLGSTTCSAGTCLPVCTVAGSGDCDANPTNGCELRNTNPTCTTPAPTDIGDVAGDQTSAVLSANGYSERFLRASVLDTVGGDEDLFGQIVLTSPAGTNFDLFVTCLACGGATLSSTSTGATDTVNVGRTDFSGNRSYDILIEVRWVSGTACGDWTLTVTGDITTADRTCN